MSKLKGSWMLIKNEQFDQYLKACNVNFILRKLANQITTYEDIKQEENGQWELTNSSTFTTTKLQFRLGEEFDEVTPSGHHMKTTITIENDKWIQMQKANDPTAVDSKVTRELTDDNTMLSTYEAGGVVCYRTLTRIKK